jgi:NAD-dependent deacetylase
VLFTEALPSSPFLSAHTCISHLEGGRDVMVVVGTTGVVYPAAGLPEDAMARGVKIIEVRGKYM